MAHTSSYLLNFAQLSLIPIPAGPNGSEGMIYLQATFPPS
jgi:hypothetical protein